MIVFWSFLYVAFDAIAIFSISDLQKKKCPWHKVDVLAHYYGSFLWPAALNPTSSAFLDATLFDVIRHPRSGANPDKQGQKKMRRSTTPARCRQCVTIRRRVHRTEQVHSAADSEDVLARVSGQWDRLSSLKRKHARIMSHRWLWSAPIVVHRDTAAYALLSSGIASKSSLIWVLCELNPRTQYHNRGYSSETTSSCLPRYSEHYYGSLYEKPRKGKDHRTMCAWTRHLIRCMLISQTTVTRPHAD